MAVLRVNAYNYVSFSEFELSIVIRRVAGGDSPWGGSMFFR